MENTIFESIKLWIKNKKNKKQIIQDMINQKLFIPGLIDTSIIWSELLPFFESINYIINNDEILKILELSNFKEELKIKNKSDYYKFLWATNLNIDDRIEIRDCFNRWSIAEIYYMETKKDCNKYLDNIRLKVRTDDNLLDDLNIPNDLSRIEKNTQIHLTGELN